MALFGLPGCFCGGLGMLASLPGSGEHEEKKVHHGPPTSREPTPLSPEAAAAVAAEPEPTSASSLAPDAAVPAHPLRPGLTLEVGADVASETRFRKCACAEGLNTGVYAGIGWRAADLGGVSLRGGASIAAMDSHVVAGIEERDQLWFGLGAQPAIPRGLLTMTPFATYSHYRDADAMPSVIAAWGLGAAVEWTVHAGTTFHIGSRFYVDSQGVFADLQLGVAWVQ